MKKTSVISKIDEYIKTQKDLLAEAVEYEMISLEAACVRRIDAAVEIRRTISEMGDDE